MERVIEANNLKFAKERFLTGLSAAIFALTTVYGGFKLFDGGYSSSQATLIFLQGILGFACSLLPLIIHKLFKLRMPFAVQFAKTVFMVLAIVLGEACEFYYKYRWWDSMLHAFSGFGIAYIAYSFLNFIFKDVNLKNKFVVCVIGAAVISLATGLIWEIGEFTADSVFGTNMQKSIPETEPFFNGGQTNEALNGRDEEIAAFFRSPEGYRYALKDTVKDIICCLCGTLVFVAGCAVKRKSNVFNQSFEKDGEEAVEELAEA